MRTLTSVCVVIPAFNEEELIEKTISEIFIQLNKIDAKCSLLVVDDGSTDTTLDIVKRLCKTEDRLNFLSFTRNFGHQAAIRAGLDSVDSEIIITMDADLQHPPELIPEMLSYWEEGFDIVYGIRKSQNEASSFKKLGSQAYTRFLKLVADYPLVEGSSDFRLIDKKVLQNIKKLDPEAVFLRGIVPWFGFNSAKVFYNEKLRKNGRSKYTLKKMLQLAVTGLMSVSTVPLRAIFAFGISISFLAFIYGIYAIFIRLFTTYAVPGWTSILVSILFIGGLQLAAIAILGEYLARIFLNSLKRPSYIIKEHKN